MAAMTERHPTELAVELIHAHRLTRQTGDTSLFVATLKAIHDAHEASDALTGLLEVSRLLFDFLEQQGYDSGELLQMITQHYTSDPDD